MTIAISKSSSRRPPNPDRRGSGPSASTTRWLKCYYLTRFAFSAVWVALAFLVANKVPSLAAVLLVAYPAWDAIENLIDARQSGGLVGNPSQSLNFYVSIVTAAAVAVTLLRSMNDVLMVFGIWAIFSGILQLVTGLRRWRSAGAQWAMILSGAQSVLAGGFMVKISGGTESVGIGNVAPYAAFGAFYFLVSFVWLAISDARKATRQRVN